MVIPAGMMAPPLPGAACRNLPAAGPDVLLADDDPAALRFVESTLEDAGYTVASVSSGESAIAAATSLCPRLVILDVAMPGLDGYRACRALRAGRETSAMPILFLSASADIDSRVTGLTAGAVDFLVKPFAPAELVARVRVHIELASLRQALLRNNRQLAEANRALTTGFETASRIQGALLPRRGPEDDRLLVAWRCTPCESLGGDALNVWRLADGLYAAYLLDASGHGVPASLLAVSAGYFISALACDLLTTPERPASLSPAAILNDVNRVFGAMVPPGAFVTILIALLDLNNACLTFASAGHPGPLLVRAPVKPAFLDAPAPPVGIRDWSYSNRSVPLKPADRIVLYSDGVYEQRNAAGQAFGRVRLGEALSHSSHRTADDLLADLMRRLAMWRADRAMDDDTSVLVLDYVGGGRK
jgi:sigma-B regulation protein RsbU (phosphoserine phosphatase)